MKKTAGLFMVASLFMTGAFLTACHEHTVEGWTMDETNHWQVCSGCSENLNLGAHTYESGFCTVCGGCDMGNC